MHDEWLTPDVADQLLDGEFPSPEFADLASMVHDVRGAARATATPRVRGTLTEFIGVNLTPSEPPATGPVVAAENKLTAAPKPRRKTVFAEATTFAGTMAGKFLIGGVAVCAAATGAHVSGVVDLPGLPGPAGEVVVAGESVGVPGELAFTDKDPNGRFANPWLLGQEQGEGADADAGKDEMPTDGDNTDGDHSDAEGTAPKLVIDQPDQLTLEGEPVKEEPKEEEPKVEETKVEEPKHEEPKAEPKHESSEKDQAIAALEAQLHAHKEAVYAAAWVEMEPIHNQKGALIEAMNAILWQLEQDRNAAKAPLYAALEETDDPELKAQIEAELMAIYNQWKVDRDAVLAEHEPAIWALKQQLAAIEMERDAQIEQLWNEFHAAVAAL